MVCVTVAVVESVEKAGWGQSRRSLVLGVLMRLQCAIGRTQRGDGAIYGHVVLLYPVRRYRERGGNWRRQTRRGGAAGGWGSDGDAAGRGGVGQALGV